MCVINEDILEMYYWWQDLLQLQYFCFDLRNMKLCFMDNP